MVTEHDPYQAEPDDHACTEELEDEEGRPYVICQEAVGAERVVGGGEFPDPAAAPRSPAPGSVRDEAPGTWHDRAGDRVGPPARGREAPADGTGR